MKNLLIGGIFVVLLSCNNDKNQLETTKRLYPSHNYTFVNETADMVNYLETDYVPVYSDIYHMDGTKRFLLTSTLSIRNISLSDSVYLFRSDYHDSYGVLLRSYVDSTIMLKPLESIEFVVEYKEDKGGVGANFIIEWGADVSAGQLLIQAVMTGTSNQQGLSFLTEGKVIKQVFCEPEHASF